jgi:hypothetical protein
MYIFQTIVLVGDACSKPPIIIKSHNLLASDIRREELWVRQLSMMRENNSLLSLIPASCASFDLSLAFPFCLLLTFCHTDPPEAQKNSHTIELSLK